jgi:FkbM family methyltransferase
MENAGLSDRTLVINAVLGKFNRKSVFYRSRGIPKGHTENWKYSSSILAPRQHIRVHPWCKFDKGMVETVQLKSIYDGKIDFVHIDVQGAELLVLSGMTDDLNGARMIWMEVSNIELYAGQPIRTQVESYMVNKGFKLIKNTCTPGVSQGDQLWSR